MIFEWEEYKKIRIQEKLKVEKCALPEIAKKSGKIKCKLCGAEIDFDQWFNHLINTPCQGMQVNQHHLILNLYYYGQLKAKESYRQVPRTNPKNRFLLRLSNFYRNLSEFILLGTPDHPIGEINLFQNFISDFSLLEIQLREKVIKTKLKMAHDKLLMESFSKSLLDSKFVIKTEIGDPIPLQKSSKTERISRRKKLAEYYKKIAPQVVTNPSSENKKKPPKRPEIEKLEILSLQDHHDLIKNLISDPSEASNDLNPILFNLECPLSGEVIVKPARGLNCKHSEVFCAMTAIEAGIRSCPICHRSIKLKNLKIDSRLEKFLKNYSGSKSEFSNQDILDFEDNQSLSSLVQPNGESDGPTSAASRPSTNENVSHSDEFYRARIESVNHYLVNLICPISKSRILSPSGGDKCDHVTVFCAESFKNQSNRKRCPICSKKIKKIIPDILLDDYLTNENVAVKTENGQERPQAVIWKIKKGKVKFKAVKTFDQLINLLPTHGSESYSQSVGARISLTCPISTNAIKWPSRSKDCDHVEVFCAFSLVGDNQGGVICPFCEKVVRWENLIIDENISKFISNYPNTNSCRINKNGKIKIIKEANGVAKRPAKRPRLEDPDDDDVRVVETEVPEQITSKVLNKPSEQEGGGFFGDENSDNEIILPLNAIGPGFEANESKRTFMKNIDDDSEETSVTEVNPRPKNLNGQSNERIKKNGKKHARYYTDGKPQLPRTCGQFNLKPRKEKRAKK